MTKSFSAFLCKKEHENGGHQFAFCPQTLLIPTMASLFLFVKRLDG